MYLFYKIRCLLTKGRAINCSAWGNPSMLISTILSISRRKYMNKKILFAAVGAALAVAPMISAQAEVKVGGLAHVSLDSLDRGTASDTGSLFLSNNSSNINIGASEDLGGGMKAIAYWENIIVQDTGGLGT